MKRIAWTLLLATVALSLRAADDDDALPQQNSTNSASSTAPDFFGYPGQLNRRALLPGAADHDRSAGGRRHPDAGESCFQQSASADPKARTECAEGIRAGVAFAQPGGEQRAFRAEDLRQGLRIHRQHDLQLGDAGKIARVLYESRITSEELEAARQDAHPLLRQPRLHQFRRAAARPGPEGRHHPFPNRRGQAHLGPDHGQQVVSDLVAAQ